MIKLLFITLLSISAFASDCMNLSGTYKIINTNNSCELLQSHHPLFVMSDTPVMNLMIKPGPKYGYFLNRIIPSDELTINIKQTDCSEIKINDNLLIETGKFPYFGSRSPIYVNTSLNEEGLTQKMLITKYTVSSGGSAKVYKNIDYLSNISLNRSGQLNIRASFVFGKNKEKSEVVSCNFIKQ